MKTKMSTKIYEAHESFTILQRSRKIEAADIVDAERIFGYDVALQISRDMSSGFTLWDSCSMIEQGWKNFGDDSADAFVGWALERIREV